MRTDFKLYKVDIKLLCVLNFNLMIPVEEEQLQFIDTTVFKLDRENIKYYKKYVSNEMFAGKERCLNFPKLETECEKFNSRIRKGSD